jgi:Domain of unknown function (DUF6265)
MTEFPAMTTLVPHSISRSIRRAVAPSFALSVPLCLSLCLLLAAAPLSAQTPAPVEPSKAPSVPLELGSLAWLDGCWRSDVAKYTIREHWLPPGGGIMVGAGQTLLDGKSMDYQYLRLETRPDGVWYIAITADRKEASFKLTATASDSKDTIFTFTNRVDEFPQRVIYRRGTDGWLYASVEGKIKGEEKKVIYPMRRVDCQTGSFVLK